MDSDYFHSGLFNEVAIQTLTTGSVIALIATVLLLLFSGFISASETALFSLGDTEINELKEGKKKPDRMIIRLLDRSEYLLASVLLITYLLNVTLILLYAFVVNPHASPLVFLLEVVVISFVLLLFGNIIPNRYARKNALKVARHTAPFLNGLEIICRPLVKPVIRSSVFITKQKNDLSVDDLSKALKLTSSEMPEEKEMLAEIIKFYDKTVSEIMTPRLDVEDIELKSNFRQVLSFIIESGYSRIPVFLKTEDDIKGILYIKDLLPHIGKSETFRWQSLIRPAYFVPETKKIDDLLEEFRKNKIHMAIVVDEFGGTSGIVTMEDILEEIVGEISDEYDEDERPFIRLADGSLIFEAKILLNDFFRIIEATPAEFEELTEEVDTLAGLLLEIKGDFPKRREVIEYNGYRFQILEIDDRRIQKVKFTRVTELVTADD